MRRPGAFHGGGTEQRRQRPAKIDGCSRQNPAYRLGRFKITIALIGAMVIFYFRFAKRLPCGPVYGQTKHFQAKIFRF